MTEIQVIESATGRLIDTVTVTPSAETIYNTGAARPVLESLAEQYAARGITIEVDQVGERLDGWTDGTVELRVTPPDAPNVPNVLLDLREAISDAKLRDYWRTHIPWGSPGDFTMCVKKLGRYVKDPKGLCAEYHKQFVGYWPGDKRNK